ncbi:hypothetical protein EDC01DRAFT_221442 [Geopyxis carbonaria]|nr:hypothetical protein EDC01DRAFT_221442 [Geopyxis carbonaria]
MAPLSLIDILSNEYLLLSTTPYLLPTELLSLSCCSHSFQNLIIHSRSAWRNLNLSVSPHQPKPSTSTAVATRPSVPLYQTEFTRLLNKPFVLRDVRTLVLDGLPVTVDLLTDLLSPQYRLSLLSIRECTHINEPQLMLLLQYLVRPSRPAGTPSLKGLYYFSSMDAPGGIFPTLTNGPPRSRGRFVAAPKLTAEWAAIMHATSDAIAYDTRLCTGARHADSGELAVASVRLPPKCAGCHTAPSAHAAAPVLLPPVPITTSDVRAACRGPTEADVLRCEACVRDRWCEGCGKWWCEACALKVEKKLVTFDCYECGAMCGDCAKGTNMTCKSCRGGYCIKHNEGADNTWCEWCNSTERRVRNATQSHHRAGVPPPVPSHLHRHAHIATPQMRARNLARLNALRASVAPTRFKEEAIVRVGVRRGCVVGN